MTLRVEGNKMEMKVKASHRGNEPLEITDAECERERLKISLETVR